MRFEPLGISLIFSLSNAICSVKKIHIHIIKAESNPYSNSLIPPEVSGPIIITVKPVGSPAGFRHGSDVPRAWFSSVDRWHSCVRLGS